MLQLWNPITQTFACLGGIYALFVTALALPCLQKYALYLHKIKWPLRPRFDMPEKYGLAPGKTLNIKIQTSDNITLGAWFIFAEDYYQNAASLDPANNGAFFLTDSDIADALRSHHTIIYYHGNAAARALPIRVRFCSAWTSRITANVLVIDYRGFGDSEGTPSEVGLGLDGRAAWDWLVQHGARPNDILLFGQSLGTGVAAKIAHQLSLEGTEPRGVVLAAPFTDIPTLLKTYKMAGVLPLLLPFRLVPFFFKFLNYILVPKFPTISILPDVTCPILLMHAENDPEIKVTHSQRLFDAILEPYLEQPDSQSETEEQRRVVTEASALLWRQQRENLVVETTVQGLGKISRFQRANKGDVTLLRSAWGGHNDIITYEGPMDVARKIFQL